MRPLFLKHARTGGVQGQRAIVHTRLKPGALLCGAMLLAMACSGCVVITVAGAAVSVASTAVGVGITAGTAVVSVAGSAVSGVASGVGHVVGGAPQP